MPNDEQEYCSWLHISDLHLLAQQFAENGREFFLYGNEGRAGKGEGLDDGGLKWYIKEYPVDAIIITGDFVLRGDFSDSSLKNLKDFLEGLYKICSDAGKWNWKKGAKMERLFWCPGNHDLNREACEKLESGGLIYRKNVICSAQCEGSFAPKGKSEPAPEGTNENYKEKLLTEISFSQIYQVMEELAGERLGPRSYSKFEAQVFQIPGKRTPPVFFVAINTALLAGQVAQEENIEKKISRAYKQFTAQHHSQNNSSALDKYKKYHILLKIKRGETIDDEGKLCFISKARCEEIAEEINKQIGRDSIVILAGHHPYDFLGNSAKGAFVHFMSRNSIRLYIHGHTHLLQNSDISDRNWSFLSVGVGGANLNPGDDYNQLSFSRGTITISGSNKFGFSIMQLLFLSKKYGKRRWAELCEPITGNVSVRESDTSTTSASGMVPADQSEKNDGTGKNVPNERKRKDQDEDDPYQQKQQRITSEVLNNGQ